MKRLQSFFLIVPAWLDVLNTNEVFVCFLKGGCERVTPYTHLGCKVLDSCSASVSIKTTKGKCLE